MRTSGIECGASGGRSEMDRATLSALITAAAICPFPFSPTPMDSAWCPVCDKQIQPKRITTTVPRTIQPPPPAPPSSPRRKGAPRRGGLVNGTGRLRPNGTVKPAAPVVVMKERVVIDQGPTALYCSDECQMVDLARSSRSAVIDPAREEPPQPPVTLAKTTFTVGDSPPEPAAPKAPLTSMEKFAAFYNFPEMPPVPVFEKQRDYEPLPYNSGIIMAGRLITSLAPPPPKPQVGRYRPAQEPRKPVAGWTDGSNAWRSAVYSTAAPRSNKPFTGEAAIKAYGSFSTPARSGVRASCPTVIARLPSEAESASAAEALLSSFSDKFTRRTESRASLYYGGSSPAPSSVTSTHSLPLPSPTHRSLVPSSVEGKLLVPDVKMRVHRGGSSTSLSSNWSGRLGTSSSSRRSAAVRSPLSLTSDSDEDTERCNSKQSQRRDVKPKRPVAENSEYFAFSSFYLLICFILQRALGLTTTCRPTTSCLSFQKRSRRS